MLYLWSRIKGYYNILECCCPFTKLTTIQQGQCFDLIKFVFWRLVLLYFTLFFSDISFLHWIFFFTRAYTATKGRFPKKKNSYFFRALHELGWGCPIFFGQCLKEQLFFFSQENIPKPWHNFLQSRFSIMTAVLCIWCKTYNLQSWLNFLKGWVLHSC